MIDASPTSVALPPLINSGVQLSAGSQPFTGSGELQATPLNLAVIIKRQLSGDELAGLGISLHIPRPIWNSW